MSYNLVGLLKARLKSPDNIDLSHFGIAFEGMEVLLSTEILLFLLSLPLSNIYDKNEENQLQVLKDHIHIFSIPLPILPTSRHTCS